MLYITIGLTITTMCIDLASDYLKRLHYLGKKIENVAGTEVWFGGKK